MDYSERWALEVMAPIMLMFPFMVLATIEDEVIQRKALSTLSVVASISFIWGVSASMEIWACSEDEASGEDRLRHPSCILDSSFPVLFFLSPGRTCVHCK